MPFVVLTVIVLVVVAGVAVLGLVNRRRLSGRPRQAVDAVYSIDAAEGLRRDVAGALSRRVAPDSQRPGGVTMRGKARKHFVLAGHTLIVRADPAVVADIVAPAVLAAKAKFAPSATLEPGEVAAWEAESIFGPFPRLVVRSSPLLPGATEVGATRMRVKLRFPQGGPFVERGVTAARAALQHAGIAVTDHTRGFEPGPDAQYDGDGTWFVGELTSSDDVLR